MTFAFQCDGQSSYFVLETLSSFYTRGQVSVNKRISVLSNYFDVSFEIYYVRLKYILLEKLSSY